MKKIKDVLRLRIKGELSFPKIALATGVPKSTVSDYCRKFAVCGKDIESVLGLNDDALYASTTEPSCNVIVSFVHCMILLYPVLFELELNEVLSQLFFR